MAGAEWAWPGRLPVERIQSKLKRRVVDGGGQPGHDGVVVAGAVHQRAGPGAGEGEEERREALDVVPRPIPAAPPRPAPPSARLRVGCAARRALQ
jgi:hypothetical protein